MVEKVISLREEKIPNAKDVATVRHDVPQPRPSETLPRATLRVKARGFFLGQKARHEERLQRREEKFESSIKRETEKLEKEREKLRKENRLLELKEERSKLAERRKALKREAFKRSFIGKAFEKKPFTPKKRPVARDEMLVRRNKQTRIQNLHAKPRQRKKKDTGLFGDEDASDFIGTDKDLGLF